MDNGISMKILPETDGVWPDLQDDPDLVFARANYVEVAILDAATDDGKPAVYMRSSADDRSVVFELTGAMLLNIAGALIERHPEVRRVN